MSWVVNRKDLGYSGLGSPSGVLIPVRKGVLTQYGYFLDETPIQRQKALVKAIRVEGALPIFRRLNALIIFRKNATDRNTMIARNRLEADRNWVKSQFMKN
jgi:hypothetical protein